MIALKKTVVQFLFTTPPKYRAIFSQQENIRRIAYSRSKRIINYISYQIFLRQRYQERTNRLRALVPIHRGQRALLVANGPSLKKINVMKLRELQLNKKIVIFGVNYSPLLIENKLRKQVHVDFLVLSDYCMHPRHQSELNQIFWNLVRETETQIITPANWCDPETFPHCRSDECLHFNDFGTEDIFRHINPIKTRNYISLTSLKALAICRYLEFNRIYLIGLDNNFFYGMQVDERLNLIENSHHSTRIQHFDSDVSHYWPLGLGDYFYFVSKLFIDLRNYFDYENITNLDVNSLNDIHKKIDATDALFELVARESK